MSYLKELGNLQKYNGKDYNLWKFQAQAYLDGRSFMGIVDGTELMPVLPPPQSSTHVPEIQFGRTLFSELPPSPDESLSPAEREDVQNAISEFKKKDKQAFSILIQLVDKPILHQIINCKTSKEIWDKLALIHQRTAVQTLYQLLDQDVHSTDWLADSGSSHHMSDQRSWFTNFTPVHPGTWPVQAVGGHTTFVEGIGDIPIEINIRNQWERGLLTDVLYVPTLQRNLFSVSSAACKNVDTLYNKNGCQMLADGVVVMEGSLEGMLYKLHIRALTSPSHANVITSFGTSSKADGTRSLAIWHQRLCHVNYPTILDMDRTESVTGMILQNKNVPEFCPGCVLGKSHRHSFVD